MTPPSVFDVDTAAFYIAAERCFEVAEDLHDAFAVNAKQFKQCAAMAGSYDSGLSWAESYDRRVKDVFGSMNSVVAALENYGAVLIRLGHNHEMGDYWATIGGGNEPISPPVPPSSPNEKLKCPPSAGGTGEGLIDDVFGLADQIGISIPDGDSMKMAHAADIWSRLGTVYQTTNTLVKMDGIANLFAEVVSDEIGFVDEDLRAIRSSIAQILEVCGELSRSCTKHERALHELREQLRELIEDLITELAINAVVSAL